MALARRRWAAEILHFWFGQLTPMQWFAPSAAVDAELRRRFAREWFALRHRPAHEFLGNARTAQAAILLFDQVPRNLFRDGPRAFASDRLARTIAKGVLERGWAEGLFRAERQFLAMPLMHSEDIADQRRSLRFYADLGDAYVFSFARAHYRMIARFGRFPHPNPVLGRSSTAAELRAVEAGNAW